MDDKKTQVLMDYYKPNRFNKMFAYTYKGLLEKHPNSNNKELALNIQGVSVYPNQHEYLIDGTFTIASYKTRDDGYIAVKLQRGGNIL